MIFPGRTVLRRASTGAFRGAMFATLVGLAPELSAQSSTPAAPPSAGLLDRFRQSFAHTVGESARWVDGLFGEERYVIDDQGASGRLLARVVWQDHQGYVVRSRLQASLPLKNLSHRLSAFVGKGSTDDIIQDKNQSPSTLPAGKNNEWLVGLGYTPPWSHSKRITLQAGAIVTWPPDAYVRANYRYLRTFHEDWTLALSESIFWKDSEQFGVSSSLDLAWRINDDYLVRFPNWAKISGATEGAEFDSRVQLYQKLSNKRALLYGVGLQGDTGETVPVRQYGAYLVYRQRLSRDWLTGEVIVGATMLRERDWARRKLSAIVGVGIELSFAEKSDQTETALANRLLRSRP